MFNLPHPKNTKQSLKILASIGIATLLASCASTPKPTQISYWQWQSDQQAAPVYFQAEGRLAVKANGKGTYASFDWQRDQHLQIVNVKSPLGNRIAQLCIDNQGVIAQQGSKKIIQAASAEELSQKLTGIAIPIDSISLWLTGQYNSKISHKIAANGELSQEQWTIQRQVQNGQTHKLTLNRPELNIKLIFDQFIPIKSGNQTTCPQRNAS